MEFHGKNIILDAVGLNEVKFSKASYEIIFFIKISKRRY